jgi:hypothetical protein
VAERPPFLATAVPIDGRLALETSGKRSAVPPEPRAPWASSPTQGEPAGFSRTRPNALPSIERIT